MPGGACGDREMKRERERERERERDREREREREREARASIEKRRRNVAVISVTFANDLREMKVIGIQFAGLARRAFSASFPSPPALLADRMTLSRIMFALRRSPERLNRACASESDGNEGKCKLGNPTRKKRRIEQRFPPRRTPTVVYRGKIPRSQVHPFVSRISREGMLRARSLLSESHGKTRVITRCEISRERTCALAYRRYLSPTNTIVTRIDLLASASLFHPSREHRCRD